MDDVDLALASHLYNVAGEDFVELKDLMARTSVCVISICASSCADL
jgi:hypothetical protein